MTARVLCLLALLAIVSSSWAATARAQPADTGTEADGSTYERLVREGIVEFEAGRYTEARVLFERAHAIAPSSRTDRAIGMVAFEQRNYVEAVQRFEAALKDAHKPLPPDLRASTTDLLRRARAMLASYVLDVLPTDAKVEVDGGPAFIEGNVLHLDPGEHVVRATAQGYVPMQRRVRVEGQLGERLVLHLQRVGATPVSLGPTAPRAEAPTGRARPIPRWAFWSGVGATAALGGVLVWSGLDAKSRNSDYEDFSVAGADPGESKRLYDRVRSAEKRTNALIGATAGVGALTVVAAFFTDFHRDRDDASSSTTSRVSFGPTGLFFDLRHRF
ncbi:MAG: tetratricopeptide repeat protein [Myxococcales bacterium]|nr:tetratricopeptide repeat protein [Myxococcales bacterium]